MHGDHVPLYHEKIQVPVNNNTGSLSKKVMWPQQCMK